MESLIKNFRILLFTLAIILSACASKNNIEGEGYRYVSFQTVPRGKMGKLTGKAFWDVRTNYINGTIADSFYVYGDFDSIRFQAPSSPPRMFRKTDIRAESWKAKPSYGKLHFVGNYTADHLPAMYLSFYFSKDRRYILEAFYTNPGMLADAILFHKDSVNILNKQGIIVEPSQ